MTDDTYCKVDCEYVTSTPKAVLIKVNTREVWIPRSVIHAADDDLFNKIERGTELIVRVREWFVDKNDL